MEKSPFIKKSPEIKSYQFETLFSRTFFLGFSFPRIYFLQDFFSWDLISWDFIRSPHTILGKKSQESKTQDFISSDIFSKDLRKFGFFSKVLFPGFFSINFFHGTFLHRFIQIKMRLSLYINYKWFKVLQVGHFIYFIELDWRAC